MADDDYKWLDEIINEKQYPSDFTGYYYGDQENFAENFAGNPEGWGGADYLAGEPVSEYTGGGSVSYNLTPEQMADWEKSEAIEQGRGGGYDFAGQKWQGSSGDLSGLTNLLKKTGGGSSGAWGNSDWDRIIATTMPTKELPKYEVPPYDESRVKYLRQSKAAAGINKLRNAVSEAITKSVSMDNPFLRKLFLRDTLRGFGEGLGSVMSSAESQAESAYEKEYTPKVQGAIANFQAEMQDYLATMEQVKEKYKW